MANYLYNGVELPDIPEPVPEWAEKDIYKVVNGQWVKQDTHTDE